MAQKTYTLNFLLARYFKSFHTCIQNKPNPRLPKEAGAHVYRRLAYKSPTLH
jgi:hypothetical protein